MPIESGEGVFIPGKPTVLFPGFSTSVDTSGPQCDVTADGNRFLLSQPLDDTGDVPITLVVNWTTLLKK